MLTDPRHDRQPQKSPCPFEIPAPDLVSSNHYRTSVFPLLIVEVQNCEYLTVVSMAWQFHPVS